MRKRFIDMLQSVLDVSQKLPQIVCHLNLGGLFLQYLVVNVWVLLFQFM